MRRIEFFVLALAAFSLGAVDGASSADVGRPVYAPLTHYGLCSTVIGQHVTPV